MINLILFSLIFCLLVNRYWIRSFSEGFIKEKSKAKDLKDPALLNLIKTKTGLNLKNIKLLETKTTWAMMAGLPSMPYMIISKDAYQNFSKDELEWLVLHEAGHYVLWHNVKLILLQFSFLIAGILILYQINYLITALLLGLMFSIIHVQLSRKFEYQANYYALSKMDNPKGLKNIYQKAKLRWEGKGKKSDSLWHKLFNVWILEIYHDLHKKAMN